MAKLKDLEPRDDVERYLIDWVIKKYTGRIISQVNTEWETMMTSGRAPDKSEFTYMARRVLEIHRGNADSPMAREETHEEEAENSA
jgi:hypothetical protein